MKHHLWILYALLSGAALATPFLSVTGKRSTLETAFTRSVFCKTFKCIKQPKSEYYSVFKLANGIQIKLDPCCQHVGGLFVDLEPKITLSPEKIRTLEALMQMATNQKIAFDIRKNCSSIATIRQSKMRKFWLPKTKRLGLISCYEDTTGIPTGQENTAPEFTPSYVFAIVLPV